MELIKPKRLKQGGAIGVIAPGGKVRKALEAAENLRQFGFKVVLHEQVHNQQGVTAGSVQQRLDGLHEMFSDRDIDMIFAATGGLRSMQLLDHINYDLIRKNPKIICGFSDITFLLSALSHCSGIVTFHGSNLRGFLEDCPITDKERTLSFLQGNTAGNIMEESSAEVIIPGDVTGRLMGGNFCLMTSLMAMGTKYMAPFKDALLMIEDVGEEIRQIDRMFLTLKLSGAFDQIRGLIIGHMTDIGDNGTAYKFNQTVRELVLEHCEGMRIPVIYGAPFGHDHPNYPLPIGIQARLIAPENGPPTLKLLESPFSDA